MKARDSVTGQFKEVYVKAMDSLPVGSEIDFDGETTDIPTGWEPIDDEVVLYENSSGSNANITLNDNASNYSYIDIYFSSNNKAYLNYTRIFGTSTNFSCITGEPWASNIEISSTRYGISNNTITVILGRKVGIGSSSSVTDGNNIYIQKVIGYK